MFLVRGKGVLMLPTLPCLGPEGLQCLPHLMPQPSLARLLSFYNALGIHETAVGMQHDSRNPMMLRVRAFKPFSKFSTVMCKVPETFGEIVAESVAKLSERGPMNFAAWLWTMIGCCHVSWQR